MIYFDSAATTLQKPDTVGTAMLEALTTMSSPGRGGHTAAMQAADAAFACRSELAELFGMRGSDRVVFTMNATHALNLAIKSLVPPGGRVVISGYEHNAVTRPLKALGAQIRVAGGRLFSPQEVLASFLRMITPDVDAVVCSHVSNVFGFVQPVEQIASICRARRVPLIIDASQSAGVLPLEMDALGAAFIAMPGHKGLYGPQGTGVLLCGEDVPLKTLLEGGTGSLSLQQEMPEFLPDRLEGGTHNMPGIHGLLAGVRFVREQNMGELLQRERTLTLQAAEGLRELGGLQVYAMPGVYAQAGVVSFCRTDGGDVEKLGAALAEREIAVRAGLHCAPLAHRSAGTLHSGTVRVSFSAFNTAGEVDVFLENMREIMAS